MRRFPTLRRLPTRRFFLRRWLLSALVVALLLPAAACGLRPASQFSPEVTADSIPTGTSLDGASVTVTSKEFTEQLILGKLTVLVLKAAGARVTDRTNLAGSAARQAMEHAEADLTWEYTGTAWLSALGQDEQIADPTALYDAVAKLDRSRNGIAWLAPARFNNTYAFVATSASARRYGLRTLSDVAAMPEAARSFCVAGEFFARSDGFLPMLSAYGLGYGKPGGVSAGHVHQMGQGVIFSEVGRGTCTLGQVNSTDARIRTDKLTVLDDDKRFFPPYYPAPNVRKSVLRRHPELTGIFADIARRLDLATMRRLNEAVDIDGEDPAYVARHWLREEGFVR